MPDSRAIHPCDRHNRIVASLTVCRMPRVTFALLTILLPGAFASAAWAAGALTGTLSASDLALIDRVTWGVNTTVAVQYMALGRDRWLDAQLHPTPGDRLPSAAQAIVAAMPIAVKPVAENVIALAAQWKAANQ